MPWVQTTSEVAANAIAADSASGILRRIGLTGSRSLTKAAMSKLLFISFTLDKRGELFQAAMYVHFDQRFGLAASGAGLGDAQAVDLDQPDGDRLTLRQLVEQPVNADFCADNIFVATLAVLVLQLVGGVAIGLAQPVDPAIARNRGEPRQKRPRRIITRALAVERNERVLHQIIDSIGRNLLRKEPRQPEASLFEQNRISLLVAAL